MASLFFYTTRNTVKKTPLPYIFHSASSSSSFSTVCKSLSSFNSSPPVPKKVPFTVSAHGVTLQDPYHWMSNINDPDFINYLQQENSYADGFMEDTSQIQRTLYSEMISKMPSKISTPPELWGPWLYTQYIPEGKEFPVLCRKLVDDRKGWVKKVFDYMKKGYGKEETLLDWNLIAEQYGYVHIGSCRVSPNHNFLAYTLDTTGDENFSLQIKNLEEDTVILDQRMEGVVSLAWAHDGRTLFYTACDQNQRPCRVQCIRIDSEFVDPIPLFVENDPRFCVDITSTKDNKYITVNSSSRTSSEVYVIDSVNSQFGIQRFCERVSGVQYFLEHHHGFFYILTNAPIAEGDVTGYYLARSRVENLPLKNHQNLILSTEDTSLLDMDIFNDNLVLYLNKEGTSSMCSVDLPSLATGKKGMTIDDYDPWYFPLPSNICTMVPGSNHDFMSTVYRVVLSSPTHASNWFVIYSYVSQMPDVLVDYDMSRKTHSVVLQEEVTNMYHRCNESVDFKSTSDLKGLQIERVISSQKNEAQTVWDFSDTYCCEKKEAISYDGTKVPLTILYSRQLHQKNRCPGLLHGYGAYGEVLDKSWCADSLSLLDRGWVIAFADVRGGAGQDPSWHSSGSGMNKLNSIYDYVSCGKYLVNEGYVHEEQLSAVAHSAGCLLVGAAINMHPDLFRAAILKAPFLDVCNTLLNPDLPLTILDYEEFGNPQIKAEFHNILKYSPYDNIRHGLCCPATLVTSSFNDSRVGVWEAAKWVARIRDTVCPACSSSVILRSRMDGGHFGEGGRYGHCKEVAYEYAFLMKAMGNSHKNIGYVIDVVTVLRHCRAAASKEVMVNFLARTQLNSILKV